MTSTKLPDARCITGRPTCVGDEKYHADDEDDDHDDDGDDIEDANKVLTVTRSAWSPSRAASR